MKRRRLGAVPIVAVIGLLLIGIVGTTLAPARPTPSPDLPFASFPAEPSGSPRALPTPLGRYPQSAEATVVGNCVAGIDPATVPGPIAQAFCVCVLNAYEQLYPTYDGFQQATASGAITDRVKTDISNGCVRSIVGG